MRTTAKTYDTPRRSTTSWSGVNWQANWHTKARIAALSLALFMSLC